MKKLIALIIIMLFATTALAAGSKSVTPAVSKDEISYNKGVALIYAKKFEQAEKEFRSALEENERFAAEAGIQDLLNGDLTN